MKTFGARMAYFRRRCEDPQRGGRLTQDRLADLLHEFDETLLYSKPQISNWEKDKRSIPLNQRNLLIGLIYVFTTCGGLSEKEAADAFLQSGGYAPLSSDEVQLLPDKSLYENPTPSTGIDGDPQSLLTIAGILKTLEQQAGDINKLRSTLAEIEGQRLQAIAGISRTQRAILDVIPYKEVALDDVFETIYEKVADLKGIRIKELNLRLHELRYLGLINRRRDPVYRWIYWRENPKSYFE